MSSNAQQKLWGAILVTRAPFSRLTYQERLPLKRLASYQNARLGLLGRTYSSQGRAIKASKVRAALSNITIDLRKHSRPNWSIDCQRLHVQLTPRLQPSTRSLPHPTQVSSFPWSIIGRIHQWDAKRFVSSGSKGSAAKESHPRSSSRSRADLSKSRHSQNSGDRKPQAFPFPPSRLTETANKHLKYRIPNISQIHRPSREELLAAATGFWSRLKVRFKWFSIRSVRPFNADEIGAFFSWFLLGHVIWIIVGTTTFFSLAIFAMNTVFAQETLARWVGNYLTKSSGVKVVFESAIVPKWGDGVITFKHVFVSRRPGQEAGKVSKGSASTEAAAAAAAAHTEKANDSGEPLLVNQYSNHQYVMEESEDEDTNYTQFDLSLDTVNVTLSFTKWFNSKGLLQDVEIKGVRGVIDRRSVHYPDHYIDPRIYKHEHNPGDFEINSFKLEDLLVTVYQPHDFRPFSVSVFSCDLPQLRRQWLFYDFLSANTMSGSLDESLFTIHPRQMHGHFGSQVGNGQDPINQVNPWKKHSRLRIDGLNIDHLNNGVEGPFSWIREGDVDIVADIMFPADNDESISKIMSDFYDRMEATVTSSRHSQKEPAIEPGMDADNILGERSSVNSKTSDDDKRFLVMDLRVHLNDIRAAVPLFTKDLSYVNNALIRPIVAYMNSRKTFVPINCRVVKRASEFDGSWTIFDSGLMDDLSAEVTQIVRWTTTYANPQQTYQAFAKDVADDQARLRRFKKVGLWSLQLAVQAFFMGLAGNFA